MGSIAVERVGMTFGSVNALRDFDLHVNEGEFMTVIGPSGSGKSTLLGIISGLQGPSTGRVLLNGTDITDRPANKRNIGLVFQSYALFPTMSVAENVAFPLQVRKWDRTKIDQTVSKTLAMVRLEKFRNRDIATLSGGQQQRVALARALAFNPEVLLLDEPLGALDRKLRQEVQVELRELQSELGITTIMVTHDQEEALSLSDRIAIVNEGRLEQVGTPMELHDQPHTSFVATFFGNSNLVEGTYQVEAEQNWLQSGSIRFPCPPQERMPGESFVAALRAETIRLAKARDGEHVNAEVRQVIYLGPHSRYHLTLTDGRELIATVSAAEAQFLQGDSVSISWAPEDWWAIPASNNFLTEQTSK